MYVGERRLDGREGEKMKINDDRTGGSTAYVLAFIVALVLLVPSAASAWPDSLFTPELTFNSTTNEAGAHPDLTFEMHKGTRTGCNPPGFGTDPPYYVGSCNIDAEEGEEDFFYVDQDLKKMGVHLSPGLMGDVNAAPYCEATRSWVKGLTEPNNGFLYEKWECADQSTFPDALVGHVWIDNYLCYEIGWGDNVDCPTYPMPISGIGAVYNERPRRDANGRLLEQGRLVVIWQDIRGLLVLYPPGDPMHELALEVVSQTLESNNTFAGMIKSDISIRVRDGTGGDFGIDSIADDIPDLVNPGVLEISTGEITREPVAGQISDLEMGLGGSWVGADKGHTFLSNPTFCDPQTIGVEFQGYAHNSTDGWVYYPGTWPDNGWGDGGERFPDPVPYQMTGCEAVTYAPTFAASADTEAPGAAPALSTVITQADDEATTKKVHVEFPKGMGVNINSTLTACSAADLAAKSCPEVSKMGTVSAESKLLPKREFLGDSVKPEDEVLKGEVFLTGREGNKLTLSALLSGFVDVRLDAKAGVSSDGTLTATFEDLPSLPYNKFTLNLFGGDRSLLQNPRRCGTHTTKATFTSHSGKTHTVETTSQVKDCDEPTFDAELSELGKGKRTGLELEVRSDQKPIKEVKFGIDRNMSLTSRGLGKKRKFGEVSATSASGTQEAALKRSVGASQKEKKAFSLKVSALEGMGVNIYRKRFTRKGVKTFKRKSNREKKVLKKKTVPKNRMSLKNLPGDDLTRVSVSLNPDETKLLRNLRGRKTCHARFIALVKTEDGTKYALKQRLRLRGKGCGKKKSKRSK